jgi:hypothetical protein
MEKHNKIKTPRAIEKECLVKRMFSVTKDVPGKSLKEKKYHSREKNEKFQKIRTIKKRKQSRGAKRNRTKTKRDRSSFFAVVFLREKKEKSVVCLAQTFNTDTLFEKFCFILTINPTKIM